MTNEEAIAIITEAIEDYVCNHVTDTAKAQKMLNAIQTLEQEPTDENLHREREQAYMQGYEDASKRFRQEPCEDAISRQAVHEAITRWAGSMSVLIALPTREVRPLLESIHKLPSVKPQENTGHWIGIDEEPHEVWECDHCGFVIDGSGCIDPYDYRDTYKYCPYCGARMFEPQERSE